MLPLRARRRSGGRGGPPQLCSMRDGNMLIGWGVATSNLSQRIEMPAQVRVRINRDGTVQWSSRVPRTSAPAPTQS